MAGAVPAVRSRHHQLSGPPLAHLAGPAICKTVRVTHTAVTTILVVDNYDSFVFNLVQYLQQLGAECVVLRNDEVSVADVEAMQVDGVLLSPGPGTFRPTPG